MNEEGIKVSARPILVLTCFCLKLQNFVKRDREQCSLEFISQNIQLIMFFTNVNIKVNVTFISLQNLFDQWLSMKYAHGRRQLLCSIRSLTGANFIKIFLQYIFNIIHTTITIDMVCKCNIHSSNYYVFDKCQNNYTYTQMQTKIPVKNYLKLHKRLHLHFS